MYIVINGSPISGLTYRGIFATAQDASEWAEESLAGEDWWVTELFPVTEELGNKLLELLKVS